MYLQHTHKYHLIHIIRVYGKYICVYIASNYTIVVILCLPVWEVGTRNSYRKCP